MFKPPTFEEIIKIPVTDTEKRQFMAEQEFIRDMIWSAKHQDLFSQVGIFNAVDR